MAEISVVATDVRPLVGYKARRFDAGGTVVAGEAVYIDASGDVQRADADTQALTKAVGIVLADGKGQLSFATGDRVDVCLFGPVTGYESMTPGAVVYVSGTAGDMTTTIHTGPEFNQAVGYAESAETIFVFPSPLLPPVGA